MTVPRHKYASVGRAFCLGLSLTAAQTAHANDHIFPAAPAAKAAMDFDSRGFLVQGHRTFLASAGVEYTRIPRELWHDRLLRLKRAGFNCIEVYTFWNAHEPHEGQFDFSGNNDLNAFLKQIKQMGMYAVVRVGPYYCAEWDSGGYPLWLRFTPKVRVREDDPVFEAATDKFFDRLLPIVAANQVNRGGSVVLVQLENEHPAGWGTEIPNGYFQHLRDKAVSLGLEVPYFFSGLHHGSDPAGDAPNLDDPARPNPWFTTEFWSVWYSQYGPKPEDAPTYDRRTWKIIAHGGNGYNYYMAHGGTNFGYTNNNEDAASYDYGAGVGQAGDLRPLYSRFKRAAWFARSFQDILENSVDATDGAPAAATNPAVRVTARKGPAGTIVFLDNPGAAPAETQIRDSAGQVFPEAGPITLAPGEIMPLVMDATLVPGIRLTRSDARILGTVRQGRTTTLVVYGPAGGKGDLRFQAGATTQVVPLSFPENGVQQSRVTAGGPETVRILAVSDTLADRTWFVDAGPQTYVVLGPQFVGDASLQDGHLRLTTERPWQEDSEMPAVAYGPEDTPIRLQRLSGAAAHPAAPTLEAWQTRSAAQAAAPTFDDHAWLASANPMPMGADGDLTADAWYRTTLQAPAGGQYTLQFDQARDRMAAFLDGTRVATTSDRAGSLPLVLTPGRHTLAVFTAHDGRDKLYNHLGPINTVDAKGLSGPASLRQTDGLGVTLAGWRVLKATRRARPDAALPASDAPGWADYTIGEDAFQNQPGTAWFQTTLPADSGSGAKKVLRFESVDEAATVFLNGQRVGQHDGWNQAFDVPVGTAWHTDGPNVLTVFIQNRSNTGGIDRPVTLASYRYEAPVTGWRLRGGPGDPNSSAGWAALSGQTPSDAPQFFRTRFTAAPPAATGPHPIWRVVTTGLGHGSVWVNGHNLGRYPEKVPINGLYVPEPWLKAGGNTLVIYDEDGKRPDQVSVQAETAASRDVEELTAP